MDYFFQDLALPDLVKKQLAAVPEVKRARAGFVSQGTPSSLHVVRSMKQAIGRRTGLRTESMLRGIEQAIGHRRIPDKAQAALFGMLLER